MTTKPISKIERLLQQRAALDAQIKAAQARQRNAERKQDNRRKILAGAAVLYRAENDAAFAAELQRMLDGFLSRDDERALFELAPKPLTEPRPA